jgi:biopolymer transport protein ExbD
MARFREAGDTDDETAIDISPLIDCVFILLIFFIVTTVFVEEAGVEVDKPQPAAASQGDSESVVLRITQRGDVLHEGARIGIGGVRNLVKRIEKKDETPVIIQAEERASSRLLVQVIDESRLAGAQKVSLATVKGEE